MSEYAEIKGRHDEGWITNYENVHVLIDIIEQMKEGLGFYGEMKNYNCGTYNHYEIPPVFDDRGKKARELCKLTEE